MVGLRPAAATPHPEYLPERSHANFRVLALNSQPIQRLREMSPLIPPSKYGPPAFARPNLVSVVFAARKEARGGARCRTSQSNRGSTSPVAWADPTLRVDGQR